MVKGLGEKTRENMAATLERIAAHFAPSA